jgi:transcription termination/antitermination protein NusG
MNESEKNDLEPEEARTEEEVSPDAAVEEQPSENLGEAESAAAGDVVPDEPSDAPPETPAETPDGAPESVKADSAQEATPADSAGAEKIAGEGVEPADQDAGGEEAEKPVPLTGREAKNAPDGLEKKWYVVHTYSGYENKAHRTLEERIKREKLADWFGQILVPTEEVVEMKRGKRRTSKRKFFPGYMLVQMAMTENTWYLVKSTPKITGFVGDSTNPPPIPENEVARITNQLVEGAERVVPKIIFETGDQVRVMDGPFANFNGVVEDVDSEKGKLRVLVSIFGRSTPVEMDFIQVEKT